MENRIADKPSLPKRLRYYNSLIDSRYLESGGYYQNLPDFISITILSYDPFDAGDIYYEANTVLTTHPSITYQDGISHIYLYCNGKINKPLSPSHGKHLMEVLKYIVSGEKPNEPNPEVNNLETVVSKIKKRSEVTKKYMQQWDRERIIAMEAREEGRSEGRAEGRAEATDAVNKLTTILISSGRVDDLAKAAEDFEYQKKLIHELVDENYN